MVINARMIRKKNVPIFLGVDGVWSKVCASIYGCSSPHVSIHMVLIYFPLAACMVLSFSLLDTAALPLCPV
jgi:hypothetical protein